jgi:predicted Holliday junction resolvase-like endonuclease
MLLNIILTNGWAIVIGIVIVIIIWTLYSTNQDLQKQKDNYFKKASDTEKQQQIDKNDYLNKFKEQTLTFQKSEAELKVNYQNWALSELEKFKKSEIEKVYKTAEDNAIKAASVLLQKWKIENEARIRQDAINRSYSVNLGKITEHLVPFHVDFPFNPKDARFIGSPIDMIVFDGHAERKDEILIYIVEIKTGNSRLTEIQQKIKRAVLRGDIRWAEINPANKEATEIIINALSQNANKQLPLDLK